MLWQLTPFVVVLFFSAGISAILAATLWRWRTAPGGMPLVGFLAAVAEWTLANAFEAAAVGIPSKILWSKISYLGITSSPVFFLVFALQYSQQEKWLTRRNLVLLWVIPLVSLGLAVTNEWHHLIWTSFVPSPDPSRNVLIYGHGAWFWVLVAYSYLLLSASSLMLIRAALKYRHIYRRQAALLLLAMPLPWVGNILYVFKWGPFPGQDLTPIGFGLAGLMLTLNLVQFSFLNLVPVARDALIENLDDGVLVLDVKNRIADINPAARQLIGADASCLGKDVEAVWAAWPELARICQSAMGASFEIRLDSTPPRYLDVHVSHLHDRRRRATGRLIVLRDITGRKQAEEERERLVLELQEALTNVKTLRGLLPICARCKKIRDDEGYWRNVEEYVKEHSEARFSHGICPDCMKILYPWFKPGER